MDKIEFEAIQDTIGFSLFSIFRTAKSKMSPIENQIASAKIEFRMLPVRLSRNPHITNPDIIASFSQTSKKLK